MEMQEENQLCRLEKRKSVYILTLTGDGEHRFNPNSIDQILDALSRVNADSDSTSALIITNEGKYVSNGLDIIWLTQISQEFERKNASGSSPVSEENKGLSRSKFEELLHAIMAMKMPTIAAICGHAAAAGLIFALAHDYRLMRADRGFLYMSEVDIGVAITPDVMSVVTCKVHRRWLTQVLLAGIKYTAPMAFDIGLIDEFFPNSDQTLTAAVRKGLEFGERAWNKDVYLDIRICAFPEASQSLGLRPALRSRSKL
eukprot:TRINITY_DN4896_c0_g1_i1.p1 TRINITY_DN4896_c0_g1~~TRINITY_DN4896_c0_g1_i1.p1  ORF type:complete len:257 (-),score=16.09 TRINITY_DN4896_c0_g1_i1:119-889(-)